MYTDLENLMELSELKKLYEPMKDLGMAARTLNILWVTFSNDQEANCLVVTDEGIKRFRLWIKTGNSDDAWS